MNNFFNFIFSQVDKQLTLLIIIIISFGLYLIGEAAGFDSIFFIKQLFFVLIGLVIYFVVSFIKVNFYYRNAFYIYLISVIFLILTYFFGEEINGSKRWLDFLFFKIQTSELLKITLPIMLVKLSEEFRQNKTHLYEFLSLFFIIFPFLIILNQPDLGSGLIILFTGLFIIFVNGLSIKKIIFSLVFFLSSLPFIWMNYLKDYQKSRIINLFDPFSNPLEGGYQSIQASIAIGSGGLIGKNSSLGTQTDLLFLPETHTDFIFAVLAENFGFFGVLIFFIILGLLIARLLKLSSQLNIHTNRILAASYANIFITCVLINISMVIGLFPIVGIPFPLMSYGGSSLFVFLVLFGILNSLNNNKTLIAQ